MRRKQTGTGQEKAKVPITGGSVKKVGTGGPTFSDYWGQIVRFSEESGIGMPGT